MYYGDEGYNVLPYREQACPFYGGNLEGIFM
jgi:hypothetical protein